MRKITTLTWKRRKAYPLGGKYDLDSALCGQSTTSGPKRRNEAVISSASEEKSIGQCYFQVLMDGCSVSALLFTFVNVRRKATYEDLAWIALLAVRTHWVWGGASRRVERQNRIVEVSTSFFRDVVVNALEIGFSWNGERGKEWSEIYRQYRVDLKLSAGLIPVLMMCR